jgi:hypothetical protein
MMTRLVKNLLRAPGVTTFVVPSESFAAEAKKLFLPTRQLASWQPAPANPPFWSAGARGKAVPLTPEKVWPAIKEAKGVTRNAETKSL